jgi:hypothetical protein
MKRSEFLKKGLLGTGVFVTASALGKVITDPVDELKPLEQIGFNHIPQHKFRNYGKYYFAQSRNTRTCQSRLVKLLSHL